MPYSPLAQLCAWYSWMHRDQASLAIVPLTRCLFTSREKEASTPVITFLRHTTLSLLKISSVFNLHPHILMTVLHASSYPQLRSLESGRLIISHPGLRRFRVCHSSHPLLPRSIDFFPALMTPAILGLSSPTSVA